MQWLVNGVDVRAQFGLIVAESGRGQRPRRQLNTAAPLRGAREIAAGQAGVGMTLRLRVSGVLRAPTLSAAETNLQLALDLLEGQRLEIQRDDGANVRVIEGWGSQVGIERAGRSYRLTMDFQGDSAWWLARDWHVVHLPTADTRYELELGTAPSVPIYLLQGSTSANAQVLTIRRPGGDVLWQVTTVAKDANTFNELFAETGAVYQTSSGTRALAPNDITAGRTVWLEPLDPKDGDFRTSQWCTAEVDHGTAAIYYRKAYQL